MHSKPKHKTSQLRNSNSINEMSTNTATHLPLLPSARRKKLQLQRLVRHNNHKTLNREEGNQDDDDGDDDGKKQEKGAHGQEECIAQDVVVGRSSCRNTNSFGMQNEKIFSHRQETSPSHPFISTFHLPTSRSSVDDAMDDDEERSFIKPSTSKSRITPTTDQKQEEINIKKDDEGDMYRLRMMKNEQMRTFSTIPSLSASTTTNSVMHFMHTSVKAMNNLFLEVDEKLTRFEDKIENMELKLSLMENKIDSTKYVKTDDITMKK